MTRCDFCRAGSNCKCRRCGLLVKFAGECQSLRGVCKRRGLGDLIEMLLSTVGITKARYQRLRQAVGLKKPCGCGARQKALNRIKL